MFLGAHSSDYPEMRRRITRNTKQALLSPGKLRGRRAMEDRGVGKHFAFIRSVLLLVPRTSKPGSDTGTDWCDSAVRERQNYRNCAEHRAGSQEAQHGWLQGLVLDPQPQSCTLSFPKRKLNAYLFFRGTCQAEYDLLYHCIIQINNSHGHLK